MESEIGKAGNNPALVVQLGSDIMPSLLSVTKDSKPVSVAEDSLSEGIR